MGLWQALAALGGSLALLFIVTLSIALLALVVLYVGSAIVVLERFARVARSPLWLVLFGAATALLAAVVAQYASMPELASQPWSAFMAALPRHLVLSGGATALAVVIGLVALHHLSSAQLGSVVLGASALCRDG